MKEIPLTLGKVALVDDGDFDALSAFKWHAQRAKHTFYAVHGCTNGQRGQILIMHRVILNAPKGIDVDHRNRNGLDNRRENVRLATRLQNCQSMSISARNNSGYKGVYFDCASNKWRATIRVNTVLHSLGRFVDVVEAARKYDSAALYYFEDFARLNFPLETPELFVPHESSHGEFCKCWECRI